MNSVTLKNIVSDTAFLWLSSKESLTQRLQRKVSLEMNIDKSLLGGALIQAGDLVIDGSLRGRLQRLTQNLIM